MIKGTEGTGLRIISAQTHQKNSRSNVFGHSYRISLTRGFSQRMQVQKSIRKTHKHITSTVDRRTHLKIMSH